MAARPQPNPVNPASYASFAAYRMKHMPKQIERGHSIPNVNLSRILNNNNEIENFSTEAELGKGFTALFFFPGAFTPTCSKDHLPGIVKAQQVFEQHKVKMFCVVPNNRDVAYAWAVKHGADPRMMVPDFGGDFTYKMGLGMNKSEDRHLGFVAKRAAVLLFNGHAIDVSIDENAAVCSLKSSAQGLMERCSDVFSSQFGVVRAMEDIKQETTR